MTWEQKIQALQALGVVCLHMRSPGDWHVSVTGVERKKGEFLERPRTGGNIEDATAQLWDWATDTGAVLVKNAMLDSRREIKWNGFMWTDVGE